jgi:hypothetical protein
MAHETANRQPKEQVNIADLGFVAFVVISCDAYADSNLSSKS